MLDPTEAKWLAKYIEVRAAIPFSEQVNSISSNEKKLYAHLHNRTGEKYSLSHRGKELLL